MDTSEVAVSSPIATIIKRMRTAKNSKRTGHKIFNSKVCTRVKWQLDELRYQQERSRHKEVQRYNRPTIRAQDFMIGKPNFSGIMIVA